MNEGENLITERTSTSAQVQTRKTTAATTTTTSSTIQKTVELVFAPARKMNLATLFEHFGRFIGKWPLPFLITTAIILSLSFGLIGLKLRDNVRDGYTPKSSRARHENEVLREFWGSEGDPVMTTILMVAKDGGSMHRMNYLEEAVKQWHYISKFISVDIGDSKTLKFTDFCGHYCLANGAIGMFMKAYKEKLGDPDEYINYNLNYPIADIKSIPIHLERNFFGVTIDPTQNITNMKHVKVISMAVLAEIKTLEDSERLGKWELEVFRYCQEYTSNSANFMEIHVIGAEIVDTEMNKDAQKMTPYFIVGFGAMLAFVFISVYVSALQFGYSGFRVILIAFCCALVPTFAIMTTLGTNNLIGHRTNSPMLIMPFLINGIGVNDAFLTLHSWMQQPQQFSAFEKMGSVLHEVGPSITTTTLTNVITFIIGYLTPTEEMSIFCLGCAAALFLAWLFTLTFFCPMLIMFLNNKVEKPKKENKFEKKVLSVYCKIIVNRWIFVILILGSLVYWGFGMYGTYTIGARLDTAKILPLDTPVRKPNRLIEEYVWKEFYPVTVIVNRPLNISNKAEMNEFDSLVNDFESLPQCRGSDYTISWIRDYRTYINMADEAFDYDTGDVISVSKDLDYTKLEGFLNSPFFKHHQGSVKVDWKQPVPVRGFQMTFVYQNNTSWDDRIDIMLEWRRIVDHHAEMNASVWNLNAMFVDQMLNLKPLARSNAIFTMICMFIVCIIFIQKCVPVVIATFAIFSITLGVTGYLSFWELDLDPVSLCAVLVSIGMAVDFVAHTTYHYTVEYKTIEVDGKMKRVALNTPFDRVYYTLSNIGYPSLQSGISTVLCIIPLVHLQNYVPLVFVKTIALVVIWGLWHGLVLLPAILAQVPLSWFEYDLSRLIFGKSSHSIVNSDDSEANDDELESHAQESEGQEMSPISRENDQV